MSAWDTSYPCIGDLLPISQSYFPFPPPHLHLFGPASVHPDPENWPPHLLSGSGVQSLGRVRLCGPVDCSTARLCPSVSPGVCANPCPLSPSMPSHHRILCRPLLFLPSAFPSIRDFSNEPGLHIRWPEDWSFSTSPSNEYSGLISFRMDWFDLLAVQGTLKRLLQHHNSKASILWR